MKVVSVKQRKKAALPSSSPSPKSNTAAVARVRNRHWITALVLCTVTFLAFLSSFEAGFPMDNQP
ncbi:MAG: hypothetical protein ABSG41_12740, partial [Bryobacteraceae bacterium]